MILLSALLPACCHPRSGASTRTDHCITNDHGQLSQLQGAGLREVRMAVVVTAASGFDLGYVWKNQAGQAEPERSAGGYYINAAQAGEPPGRWWGPGAEALGFSDGQVVERRPYEMVYRQLDPRTGEKLGRSRGNYAKFADHLARLQAAEPHATAERLLELEREAAQATRQAPVYTDMTVSLSKSISVFHASIRENERRARLAGDAAGAARWAEVERRYQEVLQAANRAGLEYVQEWAGMTRTGYHGARVDGQEPGRFEEALITVSSWLQGTSRDGDPQDHVHNQIARLVKTVSDGKYRALDTVCLRQVLGAVQAIVATHVECGLTREFGVRVGRARRTAAGTRSRASRRSRWTPTPRGRWRSPRRCRRRSRRGRLSTGGRRTSGSCCTSGRKSRWRRVTARTPA